MKKFLVVLICVILAICVTGCSTIVVKAPAGKNVTFATGTVPSVWTQSKMVWFILWGLVPLGDNTTADMMASVPDGSKVYVKTELTFLDALLSSLLSVVTIQTRSVSIAVVK